MVRAPARPLSGLPHGARNPPAKPAEGREVLRFARGLANEFDPKGRSAVVLAGSWARGEAREASDIDLWVIGRRKGDVILERGGRQVSVRYGTVAGDRREMRTPTRLGGVVPGWRNAMVLRDPNGAAAQLRSEARKFRWSSVRRVCDTYVAEQLVGWAQHVAKLLRAMETGERETASVQRGLLANRMAFLRALELEYLWGTENGLWERVGERAGPEFRTAQRAALGIAGETWREACEAALRLYSLTAQANLALLQGERRRIVEEACRRAGYPIDGKGVVRR